MSKSGNKIPRSWLCYSIILNKIYCETCWLFADRFYKHYNATWIYGIDDWQHASQKICAHETSVQHIEAIKIRFIWARNQVIDRELENQISEEAAYWRSVLERIIKIILHLTAGNNALRGNEKKFSKDNSFGEGNFLQTVRLVANYDHVLAKLISSEESKVKYLSHTITDELITILSNDLLQTICAEINACQCFSIITDSTQDITKLDQLSIIIRYVLINYESKTLEVKESFVGFYNLKSHGAVDYVDLTQNVLIKLGLDINKCRGQGYDGASVMSGAHSGVQTRIKHIVPTAKYVHCCSHNLNLVISDAAKCHNKVQNFFETVQTVFNFFASSAPRWALLALGQDFGNKVQKKVLKKVCPTRWEARHDAVFSLKERFIDILKALTCIILNSKKTTERTIASGLKSKIENFEFVLILCTWEPILRSLRIISKKLQNVDMNLEEASTMLNNAVHFIQETRNSYDENILNNAKSLCSRWGIPDKFVEKRLSYAKKQFYDNLNGDRMLNTTEENFKVKLFFPVLDTVLSQLISRFQGMHDVLEDFNFLNPTILSTQTDKYIIKSSYDFCVTYKDDVSSDFPRQMLSLKTVIKDEKLKTIKLLGSFIINNDLSSSFPDVLSACVIFLTMPITVAGAERSFSKLKLIKNYLRNTCGQERLSSISILSIEKERTKTLNIEKIIDNFANAKSRKKNFLK